MNKVAAVKMVGIVSCVRNYGAEDMILSARCALRGFMFSVQVILECSLVVIFATVQLPFQPNTL